MAFKMKNSSMAKMAKEAGSNRISPMKKDELGYKENEDKALLAKYKEKRDLPNESSLGDNETGDKGREEIARVKLAYNRESSRDVDRMSRKEARQEVRADRKEGRAERKAYKKNVKRNKGESFASLGKRKDAGKSVPGAFSSKKKKKSYLTVKGRRGFDSFKDGITRVEKREPGSSKP
jgi:hypothetical protein